MTDRMLMQIANLAEDGMWSDVVELLRDNASAIRSSSRVLSVLANYAGSKECIEFALSLGADANGTHAGEDGPLFVCILGGSNHGLQTTPELKTLLQGGADPDLIGLSGMPPLHWAVYYNRLDHAEVLLEFGADTDALDADGYSLVDISSDGSAAAKEFVKRIAKSTSSGS